MWRLVKTEFAYHYVFWVAAASAVLLWAGVRMMLPHSDFPWLLFLYMIPFICVQNWMAFWSRDSRERQWGRLPVSALRRGMARATIWLGVGALVFLLAAGFTALLTPDRPLSVTAASPVLIFWVLIAGFMSLRDCILHFWRHNKIYPMTPERSKSALMMMVLALNILGLLLFMAPGLSGVWLKQILRYLAHHWLFTTACGVAWLSGFSLLVAAFSSITYAQKRSFLE